MYAVFYSWAVVNAHLLAVLCLLVVVSFPVKLFLVPGVHLVDTICTGPNQCFFVGLYKLHEKVVKIIEM